MWCDACRSTGAIHCAMPDECGNMLSATAAADNWKAWLDDLPLPFTFDPAIGRLQDFITGLTARIEAQAGSRADAQAAVALVVEQAVMDLPKAVGAAAIKWCGEKDRETFQSDIEYFRTNWRALPGLRDYVLRALAPADGLAAVEALRVEARENAMQALASMGQAQEAYEAQLEAEAELARNKTLAAENASLKSLLMTVRDYVSDTAEGHLVNAENPIASVASMAAEDLARIDAALAEVQARDDASTPPADTPEGRT